MAKTGGNVTGAQFPCCGHCDYPGCPDWHPWHDTRCWRCLKELLCTHSETSGRQRQRDDLSVLPAITEIRDEFFKYVEALDVTANVKGWQ
jgi:hypothetical protein